jgi:O-antigen/teichoic acid export membrane protein
VGYGVTGLVVGLFAKELIGASGTWLAAGTVPRPSRGLRALRPYIGIGIRSQLTGLLTSSTDAFQPIAIGFILGASSLGYVSWSYALILVPLLFIASADRVLVPALARAQGSREVFTDWVGRAMRAGSFVGFPSAIVLLLCAHQLVLVVFGARWLPAEDLIRYFAPSVAAVAFFTPILHAFTATGAMSVPLRLAALWAALTWSIGALAVVLYGITGYGVFYAGLQLTYAWPALLAVRRLELNLASVARACGRRAVRGNRRHARAG